MAIARGSLILASDMSSIGGGGGKIISATSTTTCTASSSNVSKYASWTAEYANGATISGNKITIPNGYTQALVIVTGEITTQSIWTDPYISIIKNGSTVATRYFSGSSNGATISGTALWSGSVTNGDYFQIYLRAIYDSPDRSEITAKSIAIILFK